MLDYIFHFFFHFHITSASWWDLLGKCSAVWLWFALLQLCSWQLFVLRFFQWGLMIWSHCQRPRPLMPLQLGLFRWVPGLLQGEVGHHFLGTLHIWAWAEGWGMCFFRVEHVQAATSCWSAWLYNRQNVITGWGLNPWSQDFAKVYFFAWELTVKQLQVIVSFLEPH